MTDSDDPLDSDDESGRSYKRSKVARLIEEYDLGDIGADFERRWTTDEGNRTSLRDLATQFNHRLLDATMREAGQMPLEGEVENIYQLLTDADITSGVRTQASQTLEQEGIDVESLKNDFVSHQAIYSYLVKYRGASQKRSTPEDRIKKATESIGRLENRARAVTASTLRWLVNNDELAVGDFQIQTQILVHCNDCDQTLGIHQLLASDGCACEST